MGRINESGQLMVGAVFLLIACTLFFFSVYDIALLWRDRAKVQQAADAAALSSGAVICDVLTLMKLYNIISVQGLVKTATMYAIAEGLDLLRTILEGYEVFGTVLGMLGSDTVFPMLMTSPPKLDIYFDEARNRFVSTNYKEPGGRVLTISATATTLSDRYLFNKYTKRRFGTDNAVVATATVGIFKQNFLGVTYVPVLLK